jgi:hypothetical protein
VAQRAELVGQVPQALRRPAQWRLRIAARHRLDQGVEVLEQRSVRVRRSLPATPRSTRPLRWQLVTRPASISRIPRVIVERDTPVARSTSAMPPCPSAIASDAAHSRLDRSVSDPDNRPYLVRSVAISMPAIYTDRFPISITYCVTGPNFGIDLTPLGARVRDSVLQVGEDVGHCYSRLNMSQPQRRGDGALYMGPIIDTMVTHRLGAFR